jgi:DivIVA domain-containing protein
MAEPLFSCVRWRGGYDMAEVDAFVERLTATAEGRYVERPVTAEEIHSVAFRPVNFRQGYAIEEVDAFLDQAENLLRGA